MQDLTTSGATAATVPTQYVTVQGNRIGYRAIGHGAPLVLANRMRGTLDTWDPLFLDTLAKSHTVITFDYPGIGYSDGKLPTDLPVLAMFVREFASALSLERFAMAGWSWGGYVMQTLLVESPDLLTHAILIATDPPGQNELPIQQRFLDRALKPINDAGDDEVLFFEPSSERSRIAARESRERIYARPGVVDRIPSALDDILQYLKAYESFKEDRENRREELAKSQVPILVIGGDRDPSTAAQNWYPLIGRIPRGQLVVLPEAGHGPQHQYPQLSAKYIEQFIALTEA
ncbi:alpha/beta fold hydrolase [Cupriavidus oxalaticus]|uniref:Alpha/beta hydrolase n=1 Tax=Cupriavidus oxalaticus TaxID=96344 RepID=A0A5P3VCG7_9BURK|nr:alpha/beta hydrolase [Cupriavidus oxalaticus]QEZ42941.1 alpha/beta hydrolase [Cupriavidus oxalaticus]